MRLERSFSIERFQSYTLLNLCKNCYFTVYIYMQTNDNTDSTRVSSYQGHLEVLLKVVEASQSVSYAVMVATVDGKRSSSSHPIHR